MRKLESLPIRLSEIDVSSLKEPVDGYARENQMRNNPITSELHSIYPHKDTKDLLQLAFFDNENFTVVQIKKDYIPTLIEELNKHI